MSNRAEYRSVLLVLLLAGCGGGLSEQQRLEKIMGGEVKKVTPVSGTVLVDNEPQPRIAVLLYKADGSERIGTIGPVFTAADGKFTFTTYKAGDGLEEGIYKLAFVGQHYSKSKGNFDGPDLLNGRYSDPVKSEFVLDVVEGSPQPNLKFELTTR